MKSLLLLALTLALPVAAAEKPNIVIILADDLGYSDIRPYGGEIDTPNLDALAKNGLRFSQFYNNARCCPTRASLMTGLHPHQAGIGHMTGAQAPLQGKGPPAYAGHLNDSCMTLAQVAKTAGYATFMTGKWHLAWKDQQDWPLQRGFDRYYGCIAGATHYFHPSGGTSMFDGNTPDRAPESTSERPFYTTDAFADHARRFIDEHMAVEKERPFLLYLAFTAPHWPHHAPDQELAKYQGKYDAGWDKLREQRLARQRESGLIPPSWKLTPRDPAVPAWDTLDDAKRRESAARMSAYAAMIDRMDQKIGDVVGTLKKHGVFDNTLILFLADNGACAEISLTGVGDPVKDRGPSDELTVPSYGKAWANASATPYRLYKHFAHEGGANTPLIAHWPARIKGERGWSREPAQIIDIMATVADLAGATYPAELKGHPLPALDGISLVPAFEGKSLGRKHPLFMEHENNASVRDGDWKLVGKNVAMPRGVQKDRWELYRMNEDGTEMNDLAGTYPEKVAELASRWEAWAKRVHVYPKAKPEPAKRNKKP